MFEMPLDGLPLDGLPLDGLPIEGEAPATWPAAHTGLRRHYIQAGGIRLSYVQGGNGPPVVLLHGLGGCSYAWRYTLPILAQHYTVYALDLIGCGESDKPRIQYTIAAMAESVAACVTALGLQRTHLIGHSLGGGIALMVWNLIPERLDRVVLVSSGGMGRAMHWLLRISTLPGAQGVLSALSDPRLHMSQASQVMERRRLRRLHVALDEQRLLTVLDRLRDPGARYAFLSILRNTAGLRGQRQNALDQLPDLHTPVLLIWGARDRTIPLEHGLDAVTRLPSAHLEILPQCFHRPQIEAPDAFNALVTRFLAGEAWPPAVTGMVSREVWRVLRQERLRRRLAPAALAVTLPAGITLFLGSRSRRRARRLG